MGRAHSQRLGAGVALRGARRRMAELSDDAFRGVFGERRGLSAGQAQSARYDRYGPNGAPVRRLLACARELTDAQLRAFTCSEPDPDALASAHRAVEAAHGEYLDAFYFDVDDVARQVASADGGPYGPVAFALNRAALGLFAAGAISPDKFETLTADASRLLGKNVASWR